MPETPTRSHLPAWATKLLGSSLVLVLLTLLVGSTVAGIAGHRIWERQDKSDANMEIMLTNLRVISEQATIRDLVEEKLPGLSADVKARLAFEIWDGARRHPGLRPELILGIIDKESTWDHKAVSSAGARGLMQLMPGTIITYSRMKGETVVNLDRALDPVWNVSTGIDLLADNYHGAVLAGKSPEGDYTRALWSYNGGGEAYARLVMEKVVPYKKRLDAPLAGKLPLQAKS